MPVGLSVAPDAPQSAPDGSISVGQRIGQLETAVISLGNRVDTLEGWRDELRGMALLVKAIFGASVVSSVVAVTTLILLLSNPVTR